MTASRPGAELASPRTVFTVGHSNRTLEAFVEVLAEHGIRTLVDVRAFPRSKRNPQFDREALEVSVPEHGGTYLWLGRELGAFRDVTPAAERHSSLANEAEQAYAEHMSTREFRTAIDRLLACAAPVAAMCAERVWRGCHRALLSDYLVGVRGLRVVHAADEQATETHRVRREARLDGEVLVYDAVGRPAQQLNLFGG